MKLKNNPNVQIVKAIKIVLKCHLCNKPFYIGDTFITIKRTNKSDLFEHLDCGEAEEWNETSERIL
jgi:hypothetical protein